MGIATISVTENLVGKQCMNCGIVFAVPDWFEKESKKNGPRGGWYCPNGHNRHYLEGEKEEREADRLREQLNRAYAAQTHLNDQLQAAKKEVATQKGRVTKIKNRIGNGVCPECKRHFTNVERHMKSKHPDALATAK